ncbi:MAG: diacylglycerol kinase [Gammaproteobacteria bacterium]|nr:diacylglycerol kinase [Gammaproteobacteria bacterium]
MSLPDSKPDSPFDKQSNTGLTHLLNAARFSWQGLNAALQHEAAFRQELALVIILLPGAFVIGSDLLETALLILVLLIVLITELLNSGLEAIIDKTTPEQNELAGRAKDLGSAAVFVALMAVLTTWSLIIYKNYF